MKQKAYKSLDAVFKLLLKKSEEGPITIGTLFHALQGKGSLFLLIFLALPFCQPISLPGLSTPFGIVILFIGLRFAFVGDEWLPKFVARKTISSKKMHFLAEKGLALMKFLRRFLRPRLQWMCTNPWLYRIHGIFIALLGLVLALPLPIPFSNMGVAWPLVLIGLGLLEEDGVFIGAAYGLLLLVLIAFAVAFFFLESIAANTITHGL